MALSSVACILDGYGGWHVVVDHENALHHHVRPGQLCLVVPDLLVQEPVSWERGQYLVKRAEAHAVEWVRTRNDPETLKHPAVALFKLRRQRAYNQHSVNLCDIVET